MVSHEKCSDGIKHDFDISMDEEWIDNNNVRYINKCSKCSAVSEGRVYTSVPEWYYLCDPDTCDESDNGHKWEIDSKPVDGQTMTLTHTCMNCDDHRILTFRQSRIEYLDSNGTVFHSQ